MSSRDKSNCDEPNFRGVPVNAGYETSQKIPLENLRQRVNEVAV